MFTLEIINGIITLACKNRKRELDDMEAAIISARLALAGTHITTDRTATRHYVIEGEIPEMICGRFLLPYPAGSVV